MLGLALRFKKRDVAFFPEYFQHYIPFHPALIPGDNPLIPFMRVVAFLKHARILNLLVFSIYEILVAS